MNFATVERLGEISKEVREIFYNSDYGLCSVNENGVHLTDEAFLANFPEGYRVVDFDEVHDQLEINHNDVRYYALQTKGANHAK
jgi:hypothetical protein